MRKTGTKGVFMRVSKLLLIMFSVLFFIACDNGTSSGSGCNCGGTGGSIGNKSIVGEWKTTDEGLKLVFNRDNLTGKFFWIDAGVESDFTWVRRSDYVILSSDDEDLDGVAFAYNGGDIFVIWGVSAFIRVE